MIKIDFKPQDFAACAAQQLDALMVLVPGDTSATGAAADAVKSVLASGDLVLKTAKNLALYKPAGFAAKRVWLVAVNSPSAKDVRNAVSAAVANAKAANAKSLGVCLALLDDLHAEQLQAAVVAAADASYAYTLTKPSAEASALAAVTISAAPDAAKFKTEFAVALIL